MGINTLNQVISGAISPDMWNQFRTALMNDFVGRNSSGAPEAGKKNGTPSIPWGEVHAQRLYLGGTLLDPDNIGSSNSGNGIISAQTRVGSSMPDFIRANGAAPSFTVLGSTTALNVNIAAVGVSVSTDIVLGSLTPAPASNNTAQINDSNLGGATATKYAGENGGQIAIDNAGTEITDREGQYAAFKHSTNEIFFARITNVSGTSAVLDNIYRGYFFDSSGAPLNRETMSNNDTITLYNLAWVFLQNDATTLDVSYRTPVWSYSEPQSPQTDDYWFDTANDIWMRYDGSEFEAINRTLLGMVVLDGTNAVASRCLDFTKSYSDHIDIEITDFDDTHVYSDGLGNNLSVYGNSINFGFAPATWDMATDFETGQSESASQFLYLYITDNGETVLSETHPYNRMNDLRGWYHPYHSWRYVGVAYNNGSSHIDAVNSVNTPRRNAIDIFKSSSQVLLPPDKRTKIIVTGGGGGGSAASVSGGYGIAGGGGSSSVGALISATGGGGGGSSHGSGGNGAGGDLNLGGGDGTDVAGGDSYWGGVTRVRPNNGNGYGGNAFGGGGSQGFVGDLWGNGGGGGTAIGFFENVPGRYSVSVGGGGSGGTNGGTQPGGGGSSGLVTVEYL